MAMLCVPPPPKGETMSEVLERVAQIIFDACSGKRAQNGDGWETMADNYERNAYRATARAALEALREPTPAMIEAFWTGMDGHYPTSENIPKCWQAMLDEALRPDRV